MKEHDLEDVLRWRNAEHVRKNMFRNNVISFKDHVNWFKRTKNNSTMQYMIFECNKKAMGVVNFTDIDETNNKCMWGAYLGEQNLPKGTGDVLGFFALQHAFENMKIRKLFGEVLAFNTRTIRWHSRLGSVEEGRLKEHIKMNGKYEDIIIYSWFDKEWKQKKEGLYRRIFS
jgi:UDP-4-amino-4,6-dideoxy-N-acetyl-beta-L-altrosamine N-acetyltransferase